MSSLLKLRTVCLSNRISLKIFERQSHSPTPSISFLVGDREIVGHGKNGQINYIDDTCFPFPAVRFRSPSEEITALKTKEKGDWRLLTMQEKKALYRYSYCSTFTEIEAPTGEWMYVVGLSLIGVCLGLWLYLLVHHLTAPPLPRSFSPESRAAQLKRMLDIEVNPVLGLSSKWDYEKNCWKKKK